MQKGGRPQCGRNDVRVCVGGLCGDMQKIGLDSTHWKQRIIVDNRATPPMSTNRIKRFSIFLTSRSQFIFNYIESGLTHVMRWRGLGSTMQNEIRERKLNGFLSFISRLRAHAALCARLRKQIRCHCNSQPPTH